MMNRELIEWLDSVTEEERITRAIEDLQRIKGLLQSPFFRLPRGWPNNPKNFDRVTTSTACACKIMAWMNAKELRHIAKNLGLSDKLPESKRAAENLITPWLFDL